MFSVLKRLKVFGFNKHSKQILQSLWLNPESNIVTTGNCSKLDSLYEFYFGCCWYLNSVLIDLFLIDIKKEAAPTLLKKKYSAHIKFHKNRPSVSARDDFMILFYIFFGYSLKLFRIHFILVFFHFDGMASEKCGVFEIFGYLYTMS